MKREKFTLIGDTAPGRKKVEGLYVACAAITIFCLIRLALLVDQPAWVRIAAAAMAGMETLGILLRPRIVRKLNAADAGRWRALRAIMKLDTAKLTPVGLPLDQAVAFADGAQTVQAKVKTILNEETDRAYDDQKDSSD